MTPSPILDDWKLRPAVLATMHHKERVIAPLLAEALGITVTVPTGFNTDQFGTFTRNIKRAGNQLEAARKKAQAALEHTGADLALASEGSFGEHPTLPFLPSNLELVLLVDRKHTLEIVGHHRTSAVQVRGQTVSSVTEAITVATDWGFPSQGIIIWTAANRKKLVSKDIATVAELEQTVQALLDRWFRTSIFLETDMRAHRCPARHGAIKAATTDLIATCLRTCPRCTSPGFAYIDSVRGLPCLVCGRATDRVQSRIYCCQRCDYTETHPAAETHADPGDCLWCNP